MWPKLLKYLLVIRRKISFGFSRPDNYSLTKTQSFLNFQICLRWSTHISWGDNSERVTQLCNELKFYIHLMAISLVFDGIAITCIKLIFCESNANLKQIYDPRTRWQKRSVSKAAVPFLFTFYIYYRLPWRVYISVLTRRGAVLLSHISVD